MDILSLLGGLLLILLGANGLTDGALPHPFHCYRPHHRSFRNFRSRTDGQRLFGSERQCGHRHRKRCRQQYLQYTDDCRLYGTLRSNCYFQKYTAQGNPALYPILHSIADLRE